MGPSGKSAPNPATLTERQQKWFASVRAGLERDTGKTLEEWVTIARTCPETRPKARVDWLRATYGLGVNRAAQVLGAAFPSGAGWDEPEKLLGALWTDPNGRAIYEAVALAVSALPGVTIGPRKTFVSFARKVQFAAIIPAKGGKAELGLPLTLDASARLAPMKKRPWSEKHSALLLLSTPKEVDGETKVLLKAAWEQG